MTTLLERRQAQRIELLEAELAVLRGQVAQEADESIRLRIRAAFDMPPRIASLLAVFYASPGRVLARERIDQLLPANQYGPERASLHTINVYVHQIRKALGQDAIVTVRDAGFGLSPSGRERVSQALRVATEIAA